MALQQSPSGRFSCDGDGNISDSEFKDDDDDFEYNPSCCTRIRQRICCNRIYSEKYNDPRDSEHELSRQMSISSKTMEDVQEAIDGKVSLSKARLHRYLTTPNWGPKKKFAPYNIYNFPLALFNDYGVGTKLFFEFVIKSCWLCLIISFIYIPIYIMLYSAGQLTEESSFEQLSLGNLGDYDPTQSSNDDIIHLDSIGISMTYRQINRMIAWTDFVCILLFLLFIIRFEATLSAKEKEYDDMTKTIGDYSIKVTNLPRDLSSRRMLANFFNDKWGEVMDVTICYNDGHIIKMYQEHSKIINKFKKSKISYSKATKSSTRAKETSKLQRLQTKLDKSTMGMLKDAQKFNGGDKFCVSAYITFENEPERNDCLREYYKRQIKYFCRENPRFVFQNNLLKISEAPEPSNILYLNHGFSKLDVFCRRSLTAIISFIVVIGSFGLIFGAQFYAKVSKLDTSDCDPEIVYDVDANSICYCFNLGAMSAMMESECSAYFKAYAQSQGFGILSSVIIVIVNTLLKSIIYTLVDREKHITVSAHQSALATKIFISQFMNTALIILIINTKLNTFGLGNVFDADYNINFRSEWSQNIGNAIVITMIMGCLNPHLLPVLMMKKKKKQRNNAIETVDSQSELNKLFEGEPFTLADRFADIAVKICVILLYAPLLPLLWFILCITCFCTYWFNKIFFLRIAAIPPKYDTKLARNAVYYIKIGIALHLVMAIWVFGSKYRDPQYLDYSSLIDVENSEDLKVVFNWNSFPFFILFVITLLMTVFGKICSKFICCSRSNKFEDEAELLPFSEEYVKSEHMELYSLCTQSILKDAFGPDLLPMECVLNKAKLENAEINYKKQIAKEMIDDLMNVDIETEDNGNNKEQNMQFLSVSPEFWSIRETGIWLERLKSGRKYMYQFMMNKVNGKRLLNVTDRFLEQSIEIKNISHRSKILKAVRKLRIKCGLDKSYKKKKLTKEERKELEVIELENYTRHLDLTEQYTEFAKQYQIEIDDTEQKYNIVASEEEVVC